MIKEQGVQNILDNGIYTYPEKEYMVKKAEEFGMLKDVKTAVYIGTGVGMLPTCLCKKVYTLKQLMLTKNKQVPMYKQCCDIVNLKRHLLWIDNGKSMDFPASMICLLLLELCLIENV